MVPRSISGTPKRRQYTPSGVARCHPEIAPQRELQAARDGVTFDRGDHRLAEHEPCRSHRAVAAFLAVAAMAGRRLLQVVAGAEGAIGTGQDRDVLRDIAIEAAKGVGECVGRRRIDGVACGRAVDRDDRHGAVDLAADSGKVWHRGMIVSVAGGRQMNWTRRSLNHLHRCTPSE
jgi:hypothetical protein